MVNCREHTGCGGFALGVVLFLHGAHVSLASCVLLIDDGDFDSGNGGVFRNLDDPIVTHRSGLGIEKIW